MAIGFMKVAIPRTSPTLARLLPTTFPMIRPFASPAMAAKEVKSSGAEVAMDTTVRPMIAG